MKKVCLFVISLLFCMSFIKGDSYFEPKSPSSEISVGTTKDFKVSDEFDFSLYSFSSRGDNGTIAGLSDMKIILTKEEDFSAYCLDGNKKYPMNNYLYELYTNNRNSFGDEAIKSFLQQKVFYKILVDCANKSGCDLFNKYDESIAYITSGIDVSDLIDSFKEDKDDDELTARIGSYGIGIYLKDTTLTRDDDSDITMIEDNTTHIEYPSYFYNANTIKSKLGYTGDNLDITFKVNENIYNKYTASALPSTSEYKRALWIIEHSYPTLDFDTFLNDVGVSKSSLTESIKNDLIDNYEKFCTDENGERESTITKCEILNESKSVSDSSIAGQKNTVTEIITDNSNLVLNTLVHYYVYATTQYAVWNAVGDYYNVIGNQKVYLGNNLNGNNYLNQIYNYLINGVSTNTEYSNTLSISKPSNESYKTEDNALYYGPYNLVSNMVYTDYDSAGISINNPTSNIYLVDESGNELTKDDKGYIPKINGNMFEFYIKMEGEGKNTTKVELTASVNGKKYNTDENRGRVFTSESVLDQNVVVSANLTDAVATNNITLEYNAKTGYSSFVWLLLSIFTAFIIGYYVLRLKSDPIKNI